MAKNLQRIFFWGGFFLALLTAFFNVGIIAMDDYFFVIAQVVPAQAIKPELILKNNSLWFPLYPYLLHSLTHILFRLGITDPLNQLRTSMLVLTCITFPVSSFFLTRLFQEENKKAIAQFLLSFYFLSPLFLTRPMIESISAPFILASVYFALRYSKKERLQDCLLALVVLAVGSLFRYQVGVCSLALIILIGAKRNVRHLGYFLLTGVMLIFLTGGIDYLLTHTFHGSILNYLHYNLNFSGQNHGHQPFYTFILLFLALSFPPVFFVSYKNFSWKYEYKEILPIVLYFLVFLFSHTLSPHKEERFMVPVLGLFFALLTPVAAAIIQREGIWSWRALSFLFFNSVLLPLVSFTPPQKNILELTQFLNNENAITQIRTLGETLPLYPDAFLTRKVERVALGIDQIDSLQNLPCNEAVVVREDLKPLLKPLESSLVEEGVFNPTLLERILIKTNPVRNLRRGSLSIYLRRSCKT